MNHAASAGSEATNIIDRLAAGDDTARADLASVVQKKLKVILTVQKKGRHQDSWSKTNTAISEALVAWITSSEKDAISCYREAAHPIVEMLLEYLSSIKGSGTPMQILRRVISKPKRRSALKFLLEFEESSSNEDKFRLVEAFRDLVDSKDMAGVAAEIMSKFNVIQFPKQEQ